MFTSCIIELCGAQSKKSAERRAVLATHIEIKVFSQCS